MENVKKCRWGWAWLKEQPDQSPMSFQKSDNFWIFSFTDWDQCQSHKTAKHSNRSSLSGKHTPGLSSQILLGQFFPCSHCTWQQKACKKERQKSQREHQIHTLQEFKHIKFFNLATDQIASCFCRWGLAILVLEISQFIQISVTLDCRFPNCPCWIKKSRFVLIPLLCSSLG